MPNKIKLLPLPEGYDKYSPPLLYDGQVFLEEQMRDYARENVAHATAALHAEVEALRGTLATLKAENERLREVLQVLVDWTPSADTYRRMGFNPEAPMRAHEAAKALLKKEDDND